MYQKISPFVMCFAVLLLGNTGQAADEASKLIRDQAAGTSQKLVVDEKKQKDFLSFIQEGNCVVHVTIPGILEESVYFDPSITMGIPEHTFEQKTYYYFGDAHAAQSGKGKAVEYLPYRVCLPPLEEIVTLYKLPKDNQNTCNFISLGEAGTYQSSAQPFKTVEYYCFLTKAARDEFYCRLDKLAAIPEKKDVVALTKASIKNQAPLSVQFLRKDVAEGKDERGKQETIYLLDSQYILPNFNGFFRRMKIDRDLLTKAVHEFTGEGFKIGLPYINIPNFTDKNQQWKLRYYSLSNEDILTILNSFGVIKDTSPKFLHEAPEIYRMTLAH